MTRPVRRLIVNADDFGISRSVNQAVLRAHTEGILTTASLMVNGEAAAEAIEIARAHPRLGVGLHLALVAGTAALSKSEIPNLVDAAGRFRSDPVATGCVYFFCRGWRPQLRREIAAQFEKFAATGLVPDHVNGHLNLHLHPVLLPMVLDCMNRYGFERIRTTRDPWGIDWQINSGQWMYRLSHALIFSLLGRRAQRQAEHRQMRYAPSVFGLLRHARVDEGYLRQLLPRLPVGDSELYAHPSLDEGKQELDALVSGTARALVHEHRIDLIRYQDL